MRKCQEISRVDCRNVPKQECSNQPRQQCIDYPEQVWRTLLPSSLKLTDWLCSQVARQVCKGCGTVEVCETLPTHNCTTVARENCQTREVTEPRETCQPRIHTCVPVNKTVCHPGSEHHCHQVAVALTPLVVSLFLFPGPNQSSGTSLSQDRKRSLWANSQQRKTVKLEKQKVV